MNSRIQITLRSGNRGLHVQVFDDWFDFADYVKQENLAGREVTVKEWKYVPKRT